MVKTKIIILLILTAKLSFATNFQVDPKPEEKVKEPRNHIGVSFLYTDKGYGFSGSYYKPISKTSDLFINFSIEGVSDTREFEYYDYFGNSYIQNKVNRVFMLPLSIGMQHYIFKDALENDFKPLINFGVTPALVLTNPYERSYFNALGYFNASFAMGGFAGVGLEFEQSKNIAFSLNFRYYYLPVVSGTVMSIKDNIMKDLGGINLVFGVHFLK